MTCTCLAAMEQFAKELAGDAELKEAMEWLEKLRWPTDARHSRQKLHPANAILTHINALEYRLASLEAENKRLDADCKHKDKYVQQWVDQCGATEVQRDALKADLAEARKWQEWGVAFGPHINSLLRTSSEAYDCDQCDAAFSAMPASTARKEGV